MVLSEPSYRLASAMHILGLANALADEPSRKFMPGEAEWVLPKALGSVDEVKLTTRAADEYVIDSTPRGYVGIVVSLSL